MKSLTVIAHRELFFRSDAVPFACFYIYGASTQECLNSHEDGKHDLTLAPLKRGSLHREYLFVKLASLVA